MKQLRKLLSLLLLCSFLSSPSVVKPLIPETIPGWGVTLASLGSGIASFVVTDGVRTKLSDSGALLSFDRLVTDWGNNGKSAIILETLLAAAVVSSVAYYLNDRTPSAHKRRTAERKKWETNALAEHLKQQEASALSRAQRDYTDVIKTVELCSIDSNFKNKLELLKNKSVEDIAQDSAALNCYAFLVAEAANSDWPLVIVHQNLCSLYSKLNELAKTIVDYKVMQNSHFDWSAALGFVEKAKATIAGQVGEFEVNPLYKKQLESYNKEQREERARVLAERRMEHKKKRLEEDTKLRETVHEQSMRVEKNSEVTRSAVEKMQAGISRTERAAEKTEKAADDMSKSGQNIGLQSSILSTQVGHISNATHKITQIYEITEKIRDGLQKTEQTISGKLNNITKDVKQGNTTASEIKTAVVDIQGTVHQLNNQKAAPAENPEYAQPSAPTYQQNQPSGQQRMYPDLGNTYKAN